jgi:hypothetical protein
MMMAITIHNLRTIRRIEISAIAAPRKLFGTFKTGSEPNAWAIKTIQLLNGLQRSSSRCEKPGMSGERSALMNPIIVMGATTSEAKRLAGSDTTLN